MKNYRNILSTHFKEQQINLLLPLIEMMQDPYSLELGIMTLKGLKLYRKFGTFVREYISKYNCPSIYRCPLKNCIKFMFINNIYLDVQTNKCHCVCPSNWYFSFLLNDGVLPLFSSHLKIRVVSLRPFKFVNAHDVDYPIKLVDDMSNLEELPKNVYDMTYKIWNDVSGESIAIHNLAYPSLTNLEIDFTHPLAPTLTDCLDITKLSNLIKLTIVNFAESNFFKILLPTSLKEFGCIFATEDDATASTPFIINLLASCPNIEKIVCDMPEHLHAYFDTHQPFFTYIPSKKAFVKQYE